jgi:hypothetical protein
MMASGSTANITLITGEQLIIFAKWIAVSDDLCEMKFMVFR